MSINVTGDCSNVLVATDICVVAEIEADSIPANGLSVGTWYNFRSAKNISVTMHKDVNFCYENQLKYTNYCWSALIIADVRN